MTKIGNDKKVEILNDHYKDTIAQITEFRKLRDRLFSLVLLTVTLLLFQLYAPNEAGTTIGEFITKKLEIQSAINIAFIQSVIWFVLLGFVLRYFQTVTNIERQYSYIHGLEEQLGKYFEGNAFSREGKSYLENYPLFSDWAHILYTIAFPSLLIVVVLLKIVNEMRFSTGISPSLTFNTVTALCIIISTILYLRAFYFHK
jgi:hypothetical protein